MKLFKSQSGHVAARIGTVEYVRRTKESKTLVLYAELESGLKLALLKLFSSWLGHLELRVKAVTDFNDTFESLEMPKDELDSGAEATLRAWEGLQTELSRSTRQPEASPYQALVNIFTDLGIRCTTYAEPEISKRISQRWPKAETQISIGTGGSYLVFDAEERYLGEFKPEPPSNRSGVYLTGFTQMLRESNMLVSIRPPDKWGQDGGRCRDQFPTMYTIVDVHSSDGQTMMWCFDSGGTLLGAIGEDKQSDFKKFMRSLEKLPVKIFRPTEMTDEFKVRWPGCNAAVQVAGKQDYWVFDEDGKFLGVE